MGHFGGRGSRRNACAGVTLFIPAVTILCPESGTLASFIALPVGGSDKKANDTFSVFSTLVEPWITAAYF